jgi:Leu/Phe-tRNA-protein transferase
MPKAKKMGRPKLPKKHAKGRIVPVRFNDAELKAMTRCADKSEHKTLSSWICQELRKATQICPS